MTTTTLRMLNGYHLGQTITVGTGPDALTGDLIRFEHHVEQYAYGADGATSEAVVTLTLAGRDPKTFAAVGQVKVHDEEEQPAPIDVGKIMRAVNDPGSFVERCRWQDGITRHEPLADWQRRALRVALGKP